MSVISAGTTLTTALVQTGDTNGNLVFRTGSGGTTALTLGSDQSATFAGAVSFTSTTFALGSASAPSITFTGDTNTGIYSPAADTIAFTEGGVESMRIDSSGNVGIGTQSPSGRLHVANTSTAGTTADNLAVYFTSANRNSNVFIRAKNTDASILNFGDGDSDVAGRLSYEHSDNSLRIDVNNSERMRIDSSGNVGIGTSSPGQKLDVSGTTITTDLLIRNSGGTPSFGTSPWLYSPVSGTFAIASNGSERMRIDSSGNVGIGTSSPSQRLDVKGNIRANITDAGDGTGVLLTNNGSANGRIEFLTTDSSGRYRITANGDSNLTISTVSGGVWADALAIDRVTRNFQFNSGYGSVATAYGCRAWVNFNGTGTVAIRASGNVSSITDIGSGDYRVNFTNAMPDTNYCVSGAARYDGNNDVPAMRVVCISSGGTSVTDDMRTTSVRVVVAYSNGFIQDPIVATVAIHR